jgi:hypothetical protein
MSEANELEAIRARHEVTEHDWWPAAAGVAHTDRATLLRLLDTAREELREVREAGRELLASIDGYDTMDEICYASRRLAAALKEPKT